MDRHAAERAAPFHHGGVEMRMRDADPLEAAEPVDQRDGGVVEDRDAIPQHVAVRRQHQQGPLADGELRLRADADYARLVLAVGVEGPRGSIEVQFYSRPSTRTRRPSSWQLPTFSTCLRVCPIYR